MTTPLEVSLAAIVGDPTRVSTVPQVVNRLSRDFYWYSPVLRKQLDGKIADVVVHPLTVTEIQAMCCATAMPTIFPSRREAPEQGTTARPCRCTGECFSTSRAWIRSNPSPPMGLRFAGRACAWASSKGKRAKQDGNFDAIPPR